MSGEIHCSQTSGVATLSLSNPDKLNAVDADMWRALQARMSDFASSDAHTHPDHNAANRALMSSFFYQSPSIAPRRRSHHKDLKRMLETPPRHAFDNTNLPILA